MQGLGRDLILMLNSGGEGGIRTLGRARPVNRFRVCRIRPLCHLSAVAAFRRRVFGKTENRISKNNSLLIILTVPEVNRKIILLLILSGCYIEKRVVTASQMEKKMHIALRTENNRDFAKQKIRKATFWATFAWVCCLMLMGAGEYYQEKTSDAGFFVFFFSDFMCRPLPFFSLVLDAALNYAAMSVLFRQMYPAGERPERPFSDLYFDKEGLRLFSKDGEIFVPYKAVSELDLTINTQITRAVYVSGMDMRLITGDGKAQDIHIDGNLKVVFKIFDFKKYFPKFVWRISGPTESIEKTLRFYEKHGRVLYCGDSLLFFISAAIFVFGIGCFLLVMGRCLWGDEAAPALRLIFGFLGSIPVLMGLGIGIMAAHDIYVRRQVREEDFPEREAL